MLSITLPSAPADFDGKTFFTSYSSPAVFSAISMEPVGQAYFTQAFGHLAPAVSGSSASAVVGVDMEDEKFADYKNLKKFQLDDYYGLLGLTLKKYNSTTEEIKASWKVLQRVCHPDKSLPEDRELAEARFKAMQLGYEILTDSARRRGYDSSLPFDDRIPKEKEGLTEKDFFKVYGPVFERNERFSNIRPVPKLGSMESTDDEINEFYAFWTGFDSWREFADLNEAKPENAGSREEKRKMERENKKKQEATKKDEMKRVFQLTDDAMKKDPRMKRMREKADAAKNAKKNAKAEALRIAEESKKKEEEEKKRAADEAASLEKNAKELEKNRKQALKSIRSYFGKYAKTAGFKDDDVTKLRESLTFEQFEPIVNEFKLDADSAAGKAMVQKFLDGDATGAAKLAEESKKNTDAKLADEKFKAKKEEESKVQSKVWTDAEESLLIKAVIKFPGGAKDRWERITELVNSTGGNHQMKEVIRKHKEIESGLGQAPAAHESAIVKGHRDIRGADDAESAKRKELEANEMIANQLASRQLDQQLELERIRQEKEEKMKSDKAENWSADEQSALESALKSVGKDDEERWEKIAALVKSKNKKQCIARVKHIREEILKKKGGK